MPGPSGKEHVAALARGLAVIEAFSAERPEMSLSDVARAIGTSPATARRCLLTLADLGYVRQRGRLFLLTARVLSLGGAFADSMNLREVVDPHLRQVVDAFDGTASMAVLQGNDVVCVAHVVGAGSPSPRHHAGTHLPAHATSSGHVLLGHRGAAERNEFLRQAPFPRYTSRTPTTRRELASRFDLARVRGYAAVEDGVDHGTVTLAVPVRAPSGTVIAAIDTASTGATAAADRLVEQRLALLQRAVAEIEQALQRFPALGRSLG